MVGRRKEQQHWEEMAIVSGTSMPTARDPFAQKHIARVEEEIRSVQAENEKINAEIKAEETKIEALSKEIKAYEEQLKGLELRLKDSSTEKNLEIERQKHLVEQRLHNLINYESTLILRTASRAEVLRALDKDLVQLYVQRKELRHEGWQFFKFLFFCWEENLLFLGFELPCGDIRGEEKRGENLKSVETIPRH
jgi:predicted RNase H-like nuclease (RuvC/YqgF family)